MLTQLSPFCCDFRQQRAGVVAIVGKLEAAGVPKHVRVSLDPYLGHKNIQHTVRQKPLNRVGDSSV
jgi:hypothetical protein